MSPKQLITIAFMLTIPAAASAQSFGAAVRGGTTGFGGEGAVQFGEHIAVRGGVGFFPFEYKGEVTDAIYRIRPPSRMMNLGVDLYPGWLDFRVGGGMLIIADETEFDAETRGGSYIVGGREYSSDQVTSLQGLLDHGDAAPYANIGLGRHAGPGLGIFADFGAAFLGEQNLSVTATGPGTDDPQFQSSLESERQEIEEDVRKYVKVLPIVSVGIRWGF